MKIAFLMVSLLCAAALGLLSYIWATGSIPFRATLQPGETVVTNTAIAEKGLRVPSDERMEVAKLVKSLQDEQKRLEQKKTEVESEQSKEKLAVQIKLLEQLKADLAQQQARLEDEMKGMGEAERKNLQGVSEDFASMDPSGAAAILLKMDKQRAALMLSMMDTRKAAGILDDIATKGEDAKLVAVEWVNIIRTIKDEDSKKKKSEQGEAKP